MTTALDALASTWTLRPSVLAGLLYGGALYGIGVRRLWRRAGRGRGVSRRRAAAFYGALAAVAVALVSPVDALSGALFSVHMAQHLLLVLIAAPLLAAAAPGYVSLWAFPLSVRRVVGGVARSSVRPVRTLGGPVVGWVSLVVVLWAWHVPTLFDLALRIEALHVAEHLCFLGAAWLFWRPILRPVGRARLSRGSAMLYLFAASLQGSALGALLTFSPSPWYPDQAAATRALGLSPLTDQHLGGLLMWVPVGLAFTVVAAVLFVLWLREVEAREDASAAAAAGGRPVVGGG